MCAVSAWAYLSPSLPKNVRGQRNQCEHELHAVYHAMRNNCTNPFGLIVPLLAQSVEVWQTDPAAAVGAAAQDLLVCLICGTFTFFFSIVTRNALTER